MTQPNKPRIALRVCTGLLLALAMLAQSGRLLAAPGAWRDPATGFAIGGYDPVAYFTRKSPALGQEGVEHRWRGAVWRFANIGNRDAFAKHPEIYAPGFAGYDARALAKGLTVRGSPVVWAMFNRKVHLFYDASSLRQWRRDPQKMTAAAQANWSRLAKDLPGTSER